jgi:hypothetical protein
MASISPHYRLESIRLKEPDSLIQSQVRIRIPKTCHADPVISNLINRYGLKVTTILGALLSPNGQEDGWFDLALHGKASLFYEALLDLVDLKADLWLDIESDDLKRFAMASSSLEYGLESIRLKAQRASCKISSSVSTKDSRSLPLVLTVATVVLLPSVA